MNNPKDMLVSDERMYRRDPEPRQDSKEWGLWYLRQVEGPRGMTPEQVRELYEAELTKLRSERDELVGFTARLLEYWDAGNFSRHVFHNELRELVAKHKPE